MHDDVSGTRPPVKVSVGFAPMLLTAVLAGGLGAVGAYLYFRTDQAQQTPAPASTQPQAAAQPSPTLNRPDNVSPPARTDPVAPSAPAAAEPARAAIAGRATVSDAGVAGDLGHDAGVDELATTDAPQVERTMVDGKPQCSVAIDMPAYGKRTKVLVDGKEVEEAELGRVTVPCDVALKIKVKHPGYRTYEKKVTASAGEAVKVEPKLRLRSARLKIRSEPAGAIITVDGKVVGRAPVRARVEPNSKVYVTATLAGHVAWSKEVTVKVRSKSVKARLKAIGE